MEEKESMLLEHFHEIETYKVLQELERSYKGVG
jgi:hypothetical protein